MSLAILNGIQLGLAIEDLLRSMGNGSDNSGFTAEGG